jgi:hypothetical protein
MDLQHILQGVDKVFGEVSRPKPLLRNPKHCEECEEHELTLQAVTPDTISLKEAGSPAWDPMCYVTDESFQYFMPGLARLALGKGDEYYLDQLLFHLDNRLASLNTQQKNAVWNLLAHLYETMPEEIDNALDGDSLGRVMDKLEDKYPN